MCRRSVSEGQVLLERTGHAAQRGSGDAAPGGSAGPWAAGGGGPAAAAAPGGGGASPAGRPSAN